MEAAAPVQTSDTDIAAWTVPQVSAWLEALHLPSEVTQEFAKNAVSGTDLVQLSDDDLRDHLNLTPLQARKVRSELTQLGVAAPASAPPLPATAAPVAPVDAAADASAPAAAAADTASIAAAAATAAVAAFAAAQPSAGSAAAQPAVRAAPVDPRTAFDAADLQRYGELQNRIAELQSLQVSAKVAAAQQHAASVEQQMAGAQAALLPSRAALAKEEKLVAHYAGGGGGCLCFCKGSGEAKQAAAEAQVARLRKQLEEQEGRASALSTQLQEARSQLSAWQGQAAELETAQRSQQVLVDRMFASAAWPRQNEVADGLRALESQAAEAGSAASAFGRGVQKLQSAARGLQEALGAMGRTQMLGAVNMGRGVGFQRRTGRRARQMPGRQMGNVAEMAVFRRANAGVQQAARDVSEASALLGPGMPRVDPGALSSARAGMFQNILIGGVISDAVQLAAVRRSMEQIRGMLAQVQACLSWAQQNLGAHQQREAALRAQAASKRGELEAFRRETLAAAVASTGAGVAADGAAPMV